jgi:choline dehydrogenase
VRNLRIVDASIMPKVITGNFNPPVLMMAEKISDRIRGIAPRPPSGACTSVQRAGPSGRRAVRDAGERE